MGLGKMMLNNRLRIGIAAGHGIPSNTLVTMLDGDTEQKKISLSGSSNPLLKINYPDGTEMVFGHDDVESACICCCGVVRILEGKPAYGAKYRVILKNGMDFIITAEYDANGDGANYVERVIF